MAHHHSLFKILYFYGYIIHCTRDTNPPILNVNNGTGDEIEGDHDYGDPNTAHNNTSTGDGYPPCFTMKGFSMSWLPFANSFILIASLISYFFFVANIHPLAENLIGQNYSVLWGIHIFLLIIATLGSYFSPTVRSFWYGGGIMFIVLIVLSVINTIYACMLLVYNYKYDINFKRM